MKKTLAFAIALCLLAGLIVPALRNVSAQEIQQGPPTSDEWSPFFTFTLSNGVTIFWYNNPPFNLQANQPFKLNLTAIANTSPEGRAVGVLQVSYTASWIPASSTSPITIYRWSGNPAELSQWFGNGPPGSVTRSLVWTDIPMGHQYINFTVTKVALYWGGVFGYATLASSEALNFTVGAPPTISMISPGNQTYYWRSVPLHFGVEGAYAILNYSLDNQANATITGNTTLTNLSDGRHSIVVYASDTVGNTVASKTFYFTIVDPLYPVSIAIIVVLIVAVIALAIYRKRKPKTKTILHQA